MIIFSDQKYIDFRQLRYGYKVKTSPKILRALEHCLVNVQSKIPVIRPGLLQLCKPGFFAWQTKKIVIKKQFGAHLCRELLLRYCGPLWYAYKGLAGVQPE